MVSHPRTNDLHSVRPTMNLNPTAPSPVPASAPIHGHDVIAMMLESNQAFSRSSLTAAIEGRFGRSARFYTCSAENMTAGELVDFLESRGKFIPHEGGFTVDPARVCQH